MLEGVAIDDRALRHIETRSAAKLDGISATEFGGGSVAGLMGGLFEDGRAASEAGSLTASEVSQVIQAERSSHGDSHLRGLWCFEGGQTKIKVPFPVQDPLELRSTSLLSLADASGRFEFDLERARTPDTTDWAATKKNEDVNWTRPAAVPASPRRRKHPHAWRTWSQHQLQRRPNTPEVLWPSGAAAFRPAPSIKRRKNPRHLEPLPVRNNLHTLSATCRASSRCFLIATT